jgi:hypothetical protein
MCDERRGSLPRFFVAPYLSSPGKAAAHRSIVAVAAAVLENRMVPDQTSIASRLVAPIVIDDRSRLPGRFFGRFATSATSELTRAA